MIRLHDDLESWWQETNYDLRPADQAASAVRELDSRYRLPDDFRAYLLSLAVVKDVFDEAAISWWTIERIKNIADEIDWPSDFPELVSHKANYLCFADHAIWCSAWAISCVDGENFGKIAIIGGNPDKFIADSFTDLIQRYLEDPETFVREQYGTRPPSLDDPSQPLG